MVVDNKFLLFTQIKDAYLSRAQPAGVRFNRVKALARKVDRFQGMLRQFGKKLRTAKRKMTYLQSDLNVCMDTNRDARERLVSVETAENLDDLGNMRIPNTKW